jgi:hypothetical protein
MSLIERIDASAYAEWIRNSDVLYPWLQVLHIIGLTLVVGSLIVSNVRLLGAGQSLPLRDFSRHLYRWVLLGALLILLTGTHMGLSFFAVFAINPVMWIKLGLLALAIVVNVPLYRWAFAAVPQPAGGARKALAVLSITLLLSIIVMGKLLAYIGGKD